MVVLKPGDRIDCRVKDGNIVSPYREYDDIKTFEIVAVGDYGYHLYVPQHYSIKNTIIVDAYRCRRFDISKRFLGEDMIHITENLIYSIRQQLDGMFCCKCSEFYGMAEANQEDGTLICYSCRQNPYL